MKPPHRFRPWRWREGRSPHPLFDPTWYLERHAQALTAGLEPLTHFVTAGAFEGLDPGPWFDMAHYVAARGASLPAGVNPLVDYLQGGAWAIAAFLSGDSVPDPGIVESAARNKANGWPRAARSPAARQETERVRRG